MCRTCSSSWCGAHWRWPSGSGADANHKGKLLLLPPPKPRPAYTKGILIAKCSSEISCVCDLGNNFDSCKAERSQGVVLLVLGASHIYKRLQALWALDSSAPGKLKAISAFPIHDVKFGDQLKNCEDAIILDGLDGWALLSCDSGRDQWNTVMVSLQEIYFQAYNTSEETCQVLARLC